MTSDSDFIATYNSTRRSIAIGFINTNHFIEQYLHNGHQIPPQVYKWYEYRLPIAEGWDTAYTSGLQLHSNLFSSFNDFGCIINID